MRPSAPNWVAEHLGASSRRPRHPFPALMAGEPWPCTCVHGPKNKPVDECQLRSLHSVLHCLDHPRHLSTQRQACEQRLQHQHCNCGNSTNFSVCVGVWVCGVVGCVGVSVCVGW